MEELLLRSDGIEHAFVCCWRCVERLSLAVSFGCSGFARHNLDLYGGRDADSPRRLLRVPLLRTSARLSSTVVSSRPVLAVSTST